MKNWCTHIFSTSVLKDKKVKQIKKKRIKKLTIEEKTIDLPAVFTKSAQLEFSIDSPVEESILIVVRKNQQRKAPTMTKKLFAILDIETVTDARLAFDIAWILCDSKGNILERHNYLVKEIVDSPFGMMLLKRDSFMKNKSQMYIDAINDGSIDILNLDSIASIFNETMYNYSTRYNKAKVVMCAYNAHFDYSVLTDNMQNYYGVDFFDESVEVYDIMTMALSTICDTNKYVQWCVSNGATTNKGNVKTNAETVYAYLTNNATYVEEHHALADCEIEKDIFFKAKSYKKKLHVHFAMPMFRCKEWKKVQARKA
jgi:hypothetical protein